MGLHTLRSSPFIPHQRWVNGTVSLDMMQKIGYYDLKWRLAMLTWLKMLHGRAEVNLQSTDAVVTEGVLWELLEDGRLGPLTHAYNGTLSLNHEARTLFVRSVMVTVTAAVRLFRVPQPN